MFKIRYAVNSDKAFWFSFDFRCIETFYNIEENKNAGKVLKLQQQIS